MEIVKFKNGTYGIRKTNFLFKILGSAGLFKDLRSHRNYWWFSSSEFFQDCQSKNLQDVEEIFKMLVNGDPVDQVLIKK
jgi:hypothetical protein